MHPAVKLMLARIESNPEEFADKHLGRRWSTILNDIAQTAPREQWKALSTKISAVRMDQIHKDIMQELCAPEQGELNFVPRPSSIIAPAKMLKDVKDILDAQMQR